MRFSVFWFVEENDGNFTGLFEESRVIREVSEFLCVQFLHLFVFLDCSFIIICLLSFHQQHINGPIPFSARSSHPLNHSYCGHASFITEYCIDFSNVKSLLPNRSGNQSIEFVGFVPLDEIDLLFLRQFEGFGDRVFPFSCLYCSFSLSQENFRFDNLSIRGLTEILVDLVACESQTCKYNHLRLLFDVFFLGQKVVKEIAKLFEFGMRPNID